MTEMEMTNMSMPTETSRCKWWIGYVYMSHHYNMVKTAMEAYGAEYYMQVHDAESPYMYRSLYRIVARMPSQRSYQQMNDIMKYTPYTAGLDVKWYRMNGYYLDVLHSLMNEPLWESCDLVGTLGDTLIMKHGKIMIDEHNEAQRRYNMDKTYERLYPSLHEAYHNAVSVTQKQSDEWTQAIEGISVPEMPSSRDPGAMMSPPVSPIGEPLSESNESTPDRGHTK